VESIGFLGGGNMAEALINGIITANLFPNEKIFASDIRKERLEHLEQKYSINTIDNNAALAQKVDILVLCVKPQQFSEAIQSIKNNIESVSLVISIAAGVRTCYISDALGDIAIVRAMPNTPALIGESATAVFANKKAQPMLKNAEKIFSSFGKCVIVDDEGLIDAVTAVSGSGPAYYFLLTEHIINAAIQLGLPENIAKTLVLQTAKGAALLAESEDKNNQSVEQLRKKVTSPGGTTEAALKKLAERKIDSLISEAIKAARDRSEELSQNS
jgi:pyrroline-5-carboxylate reductase